jgi:hypothetical protein
MLCSFSSPRIWFPIFHIQPTVYIECSKPTRINYSTVTDLAKFLGLSMSLPFFKAT